MKILLAYRTLPLLLTLGIGWIPSAEGQMVDPAAPLLSAEEGAALTEWATGELYRLEAAAAQEARELPMEVARLRALYHLTVNEKNRLDEAREFARALMADPALPGSLSLSVEALGGALEVVRAKHSRWPPNKLKYLEQGISILDQLVLKDPDNVEIRYLRLMSTFYLPFFVSREDSVAEDFRALAHLLPLGPGTMPPALYRGTVEFVLANGDLAEDDRSRLGEILQ